MELSGYAMHYLENSDDRIDLHESVSVRNNNNNNIVFHGDYLKTEDSRLPSQESAYESADRLWKFIEDCVVLNEKIKEGEYCDEQIESSKDKIMELNCTKKSAETNDFVDIPATKVDIPVAKVGVQVENTVEKKNCLQKTESKVYETIPELEMHNPLKEDYESVRNAYGFNPQNMEHNMFGYGSLRNIIICFCFVFFFI